MKDKAKYQFSLQAMLEAAIVVALIWFYWPVLAKLVNYLASSEDYSYGLLIPVVSVYIVYTKLPEIRRESWQPTWVGLAVMFLGFCLYIFGELASDLFIPRVSFIIVISGLLLLTGGWAVLRLFAFPLLLLFLMLPLPGFIIKQLTIPLQLISSQLATWLLQTVGVPAVRYGNVIDLGVRQLQVVAACSGLRYILSLVALGVIFCYFYQRKLWKAVILILAVIPAAVLSNALRVAGMGVYPALQEGFWHTFSGWLIFLFCFSFLGLLNLVMDYIWSPPPVTLINKASPTAEPLPNGSKKSCVSYLVAALVLVMVAGPVAGSVSLVPPVPLRQSFANFPMQLGPWQGRQLLVDPAVIAALQSDAQLSADYINQEHETVSLWVDYYANQRMAHGVHSPFACLQGGGWTILKTSIIEVAPGLPVNYVEINYLGERFIVFYWFIQRGRWMTSEYLGKLYMGYDRLTSRRADGVLIRLITPVGKDVESARDSLSSFARLLIQILPKFISIEPMEIK
jgi:exosortase D (VPLPA-CTERM-specific)